MFQRPHFQPLLQRVKEPRRFIQVIMGPRQVGKTTLVRQLLEESGLPHHFASADAVPASNQTWLAQQWETARLKRAGQETGELLLVIDEIQKIDNWSETAKLFWDEDSRTGTLIKVILLGSSRLLLQQGLTESLAGRFEITYMGHWSLAEMQAAFGWTPEQYAWFGGYPGSSSLTGDEHRWKAYVTQSLIDTSISKDILMLTRVDKPALMKRLFEIGCLYSGQILSYNKMLGQLQDAGNTTTLAHYLDLLNTAGLLGGLEKYAMAAVRQKGSSPKFQVHNTALLSAQREEVFQEVYSDPQEWGRIVENAVGSHLLNASFQEGYKLYYWRERHEEVDFVLERRGKVIGLEVKSGSATSTSGMTAFQKQFNPQKLLLIGNGGLPWQEFLQMNPQDLF